MCEPHLQNHFATQLVMTLNTEVNTKGVTAVDDLQLWVGPCAMSPINCDFEMNGCGWRDDESYPLQWSRALAKDGAESVGIDHTTMSIEGEP